VNASVCIIYMYICVCVCVCVCVTIPAFELIGFQWNALIKLLAASPAIGGIDSTIKKEHDMGRFRFKLTLG
jgi:hypothetical protein